MRKWRFTLYISSFSLYVPPLYPFPPSLSISYIKICHILSQNVKYGTFVANVTKNLTYMHYEETIRCKEAPLVVPAYIFISSINTDWRNIF